MSGKKKILQIITLSEIGGAQKILYYIVAGLDPALFDITVICAPGGELVGWLEKLGYVRIIEMPELKRQISPVNDARVLKRLYLIIKKERFDIVHCHSSKAGILGRLAAGLARVPRIVFTVHGWGLNQKWPVRSVFVLAERLTSKFCTDVICVSRADYERALKMRLVAPEKLKIIHNGLPVASPSNGLRAKMGLSAEDVVVVMVARLTPPKDPLFYLESAREILKNKKFDKVKFILVGDGPLYEQCDRYIKNYSLTNNVFLLGTRENAASLFYEMDIAVLFSKWEGLPLSVIEAMLAGKPVIASDVGGIKELVENNVNGLLVKPGDLAGAINALKSLIMSSNLRAKMGQKGRKKTNEFFSLEKMQKEYVSVFVATVPGTP